MLPGLAQAGNVPAVLMAGVLQRASRLAAQLVADGANRSVLCFSTSRCSAGEAAGRPLDCAARSGRALRSVLCRWLFCRGSDWSSSDEAAERSR